MPPVHVSYTLAVFVNVVLFCYRELEKQTKSKQQLSRKKGKKQRHSSSDEAESMDDGSGELACLHTTITVLCLLGCLFFIMTILYRIV